MTDRETARQQIAALVEKYRHLTDAQKRSYSEEDVKKDFLLPLFEALGWDTANTQRRSEVRAEEKIAEGYPDYSFRLNSVPVFYLEAKKFSVNIGDDKPMKQAINYSYLKGVTWAVLSDFEGLMVFNADWEERDPIKARMLDLHWQDYAGSDFDDLWLLSREAIEAGEIDRTAERFGRKKKRDDVNKVLFADLTQWRHELFNEITQMGTTLWSRDYAMVDEAIQRFLDRLIFIRTVEDRRIEENRLRAALRQYTSSKNKSKNLFGELLKLFRELDSIYNARLFAQHRLDTDLEIHDVNLLTTIINGLYDVKGGFANYDFAAIDADVLGAVYEQYLSFKAQDPQGQEALDLSKRSKRKAQGIYYTPKYVVRYIVQQTLGNLLEAPDMTPERAHALRILDPACGSGSFLIEAFQVLDRWLAQHGDETDRTDRRARRMRILRENLYGVDLDPQAVEVAQLNLLLQAAHEREKLMLLPHIQQGNSLISDPAVAGSDAFVWEERFPEVMAGKTRPLWFVTFVTHNSRVSERMVTYGTQTDAALVFSLEEQIQMAECLADAIRQYAVPVAAWNVLPDHVHMVIGAEDEAALNEYVRKIKGSSSYAFKRRLAEADKGQQGVSKGLKPPVSERVPGTDSGLQPTASRPTDSVIDPTPIWARKFNRQLITDETALYTILQYVRENHHKHSERWGTELETLWQHGLPDRGLQPLAQIINAACIPVEEASRIPGGFDVVIGNPPYVRQESLGTLFKDYAAHQYETYAGTADLYVYFIEKAIDLLQPGGQFGYIIPNKWMRANYGKPLRHWLKQQAIEQIVDFGDLPVFEEATTYPCIVTIQKHAAHQVSSLGSGLKPTVQKPLVFTAAQVTTLNFGSLEDYVSKHLYTVNRDSLDDAGWSLVDSGAQNLLSKLHHVGIPLGKYVDNKIYYGVKTGFNQAFVIDEATRDKLIQADEKSRELIKPFLFGRDIKRYQIPQNNQYLVFTRRGTNLAEYPAISQHLHQFKARLTPKPNDWDEETWEGRKGGNYEWYEIQDTIDYYNKFENPKILFAEIATRGQFVLDDVGFYCDTTAFILANASMYLLGILNSKLLTWIFSKVSSEIRGGFLRWKRQYTEGLPIRTINFDDPDDKKRHDDMVAMVERMLKLKADHAQAETNYDDRRHDLAHQIERLDKQIDALVYELYGLTADEIAIVEGSAS